MVRLVFGSAAPPRWMEEGTRLQEVEESSASPPARRMREGALSYSSDRRIVDI